MSIRLFTLGGLQGYRADTELDWLASQWLRAAVLTYLALERTCTRDTLQAMLWPESDADSAAHRLSQAVYALRRALGEDCIETRGRELRVSEAVQADALDFEQLLKAGRAHDAISLYRGPFLAGVHLANTSEFENWVDARRSKYARLFRKACRAEVEQRVQAGDLAGAIAVATGWVAPDPIDDEAQHGLIELLIQTGQRTEARKQYESYARLLEPDGLQPLEQTRALMATLDSLPVAPAPKLAAKEGTGIARADQGEAESAPPIPPSKAKRPVRRRAWAVWAFAAVLVSVAMMLVPWPKREDPPPSRIAVLYFRDHSDAQQLGWLARAVTRGLIDVLETPALQVLSTNAIEPYRDGKTPSQVVAEQLEVPWLIGGTVDSLQNRMIVRVELTDGTGRKLASEEIVRDRDQEFALIDAVTDRAATFLRRSIGQQVRLRTRERMTNARAFRLMHEAGEQVALADRLRLTNDLAAASQWLHRADSTLAEAAREDAASLEPHIERAWLARKMALTSFWSPSSKDQPRLLLDRGVAAADAALRIRADDARALEVRGVLRVTAYRSRLDTTSSTLEQARLDLKRATDVDPNRARAYAGLSDILFKRGQFAEARLYAEKAYETDAYLEEAGEILDRLFDIDFESGNDAAARKWCTLIQTRLPDAWLGASCQLMLAGWSAEDSIDLKRAETIVVDAVAATAEPTRESVDATLRLLLAGVVARTDAESANRMVRRVMSYYDDDTERAAQLTGRSADLLQYAAGVHVRLGNFNEAETLLQRFAAARSGDFALLAGSRRFSALRSYERADPPARR